MTITLRDVEQTLRRRLGAEPLKTYWRETKNSNTNQVVCTGFESRYAKLSPKVVHAAMSGVTQVERKKFKDRYYVWLLRWEHRSATIKFRCTLYVQQDNSCHFVFTTEW